MASLGLWTLPFCRISPTVAFVNLQSGLNLSDVLVALHRFPSSHAPVFLGWHLNGVGLLPPPAATTQDGEPSTHETIGQACWSGPLPVVLQPRRGADPSLNKQTCSLRAKPACCDFARLALLISQHRSASSKRKPRSPLQLLCFWYFRPAWHYAPRQAYWNEDGILSDHSSPNCCFAGDPRSSC